MEARLPRDKLEKCKNLMKAYVHLKKIKIKQLESFTGLLTFICQVVAPGQPFLRRLHGLTKGNREHPYFSVKLSAGVRADLKMWLHLIKSYNVVTIMPPLDWSEDTVLHLYTDASGTIGYGLVLGSHFALGCWPESWKQHHITLLELFPILLAFKLFGDILHDKKVCIHTDNMALVSILNNQTSKHPLIMVLVRIWS